ncbi:MAG: efflux RND transporter periplasmic adaptor subunit [Thermoanaerobaculales bacterium]|nr:efflux RND transporter periplasmic adaptor subunit [Thermoanaerobaculales bacterium]
MTKRTLKIVTPIAILILGLVAAKILASSRRAPERLQKPTLGPLVEVITAQPMTVRTVVRGHGEVRAKTTVEIVPQVAGRVIAMHPGMVTGGHFGADEPLLTIEPRDYELAVERARAAVARADVALEREQAEAEVALQEWDAIHPGEDPSSGLVVREPQVRQAEAELAAAQADLAVARLSLERTTITLPFDGIVESETIDLGQYVTIGKKLATVYGTAVAEVRVPLAERELAWFRVPTRPGIKGPPATVIANFGGMSQTWSGEVVRMEAKIDTTSRMVPVVIAVSDPFRTNGHDLPLLPGTFVKVEISGHDLEQVVAVPRHAIHEGNMVWIVEGENLKIVPVTTARTDLDTAYVVEGLEPGDLVVISQLDAVTNGMVVRTIETPTKLVDDTATSSQTRSNGPGVGSQVSGLRHQVSGIRSQVSGLRSQIAEYVVLPETCYLRPETATQRARSADLGSGSTGSGSFA